MNNAKFRLQALGLLNRAFKAATDEELNTAIDALSTDHREALDELVSGDADADLVRAATATGRLDGTMESAALVITDACLADCIEQLGDSADHPSSDELRAVLPSIAERHGIGITRIMLAATVAGEAPAAAIIRDVLKNDDELALPPEQITHAAPVRQPNVDDEERAALKAKRKQLKDKKKQAARQRREQAARAKRSN